MSWALTSYLALAGMMAAGVAWYQIKKPPAKVVSLVAAMAAFAIIGRIVFAPIPNVKPTTDIVFFTGYVLGGLPGAAVGATAAFASNFFFGQGPWTPWQMLAWGLTGAFGALLAKLGFAKAGRVGLALACAFAGLAFGAIMNFSTWITFTGTHTAASFMAISATAVWFDVAHALGNFLLALAVGPAFVRSMSRYRRRFQVEWSAAVALVALSIALPLYGAAPAQASSVSDAVTYLKKHQNPDGGFGSTSGEGSSQLFTGWAALGLEAAGEDPGRVARSGKSVVDYMTSHMGQIDDLGDLLRTTIALQAAGVSVTDLSGRDLKQEVLSKQRANGSFAGQVNMTAFGVMALKSLGPKANSNRVAGAARWLVKQQNQDGGFGFSPGAQSGVDMSGAVLQALAAAGRGKSRAAERAVSYLIGVRGKNMGYGQFKSDVPNAQSTAWAVQGLVAVGRGVKGTIQFLKSLQGPDGSFRYSRTSDQTPIWVTAQALPALLRKPFPLETIKKNENEVASKLPRPLALLLAAVAATIVLVALMRKKRRMDANRRRHP